MSDNIIDWSLLKDGISFATVNVYISKRCDDLRNGIIDKSTLVETSKCYLKEDLQVMVLSYRNCSHNLHALEHILVYLLKNNKNIVNFEQLIDKLNHTFIITSNEYKDIDGKRYYKLYSTASKAFDLKRVRFEYQGFEVTDNVYVKATDEELFNLYKDFGEQGIEHADDIRRKHRKKARAKYDLTHIRKRFKKVEQLLF